MNRRNKANIKQRVIALLTREEMEFLEKLGMDSLFSTGARLSRIDIISALLDAAMELELSAKGVRGKKELVDRILNAIHAQVDKRRYPRFKKNLCIGFRKMDSQSPYKQSKTGNVSMGGFSMETSYLDGHPAVHEVIEISIREPQEEQEPLKAIGRIAWIKEHEETDSLEMGVMLTYIKEEDRARFARYLSEDDAADAKSGAEGNGVK